MNLNSKAKRILCYGDSNTWGWVPFSMGNQRYSVENRWPGILQNKLGDKYEVIEEGLGARTTAFDDPRPEFPARNGLKSLPAILESHLPLDFVIFMLGTTDTKEMLSLDSRKITEGMQRLIKIVKTFRTLENTLPPKILVIVPPIVEEEADFASKLFKGATVKTKELVESYKKLAEEESVLYLDPTKDVKVDEKDCVHIDLEGHKKLAELVYKIVLET